MGCTSEVVERLKYADFYATLRKATQAPPVDEQAVVLATADTKEDRAKAFVEQEHPTVKESKMKIPPKIEQHPKAFMAGRTAGLLVRLTHRVGLPHRGEFLWLD